MIVARTSRPVEHVRERVAEHVAAELTSDPTIIAGTISDDPFFPVLVRAAGSPELTLLTELDPIESFYAARVGTFEILDTTRLTELRTDWYALHESIATIRHVGPYQGIDGTGQTHRVHSVVLFPVDDDGIVGELEWTSVNFAKLFAGESSVHRSDPGHDAEPHIPHQRLERALTHDQLINSWWAGRSNDVESLMEPTAAWASKHVHSRAPLTPLCSTQHSTVAELVQSFDQLNVRSMTRLQRYAASWFSFGEWTAEIMVEGEAIPIRTASLLAFDGTDRAVGHLAYSVDTRLG